MSKKHQEVMNKMFEEVQNLIEATYRQGRVDQVTIDQAKIDSSLSAGYERGHSAGYEESYVKGFKDGKATRAYLLEEEYKKGYRHNYEKGRVAGYEEGKADGKAVSGVALRKSYLEGRYEGFSEGHKEGRAEQAAEPESEPEPVFARAHGQPWIPEDQAEQEHATNHEADPEFDEDLVELELHVDPALLQYFPFMSRLNILLPGA